MATVEEIIAANETKHYAQVKMLVPPSDPKHVVTLEFLEGKLAGLLWDAVKAASPTDIAGTLDATGMILTAGANGEITDIDDVPIAVGDRILLANQADAKQNGIYVVTDVGSVSTPAIFTRSEDANDADEFKPNKKIWVKPGGTDYGDIYFKLANSNAIVIGTDDINFALDTTASLVEEHATITGNGTDKEYTITHTLNTLFLTYDARDADMVDSRFIYVPENKATIKVYSGIPLENGKVYTIMLRGTVER